MFCNTVSNIFRICNGEYIVVSTTLIIAHISHGKLYNRDAYRKICSDILCLYCNILLAVAFLLRKCQNTR